MKAKLLAVRKRSVSVKGLYVLAFAVLIFSVAVSIFTRAPFAFQDEQTHYVRALGVSNGQLLSHGRDGNAGELGHDIDKSQAAFVDEYIINKGPAVSSEWISRQGSGMKLSGDSTYLVNTSTAPYTPVAYAPYAIGAKVSTIFTQDVHTQFIFMRAFGAMTLILIILLAFKVAPKKMKWVILAIALLPMSLATFAAVSADGFTIAISLMFMAWLMNIVEKIRLKELRTRDIAVLGGVSLVLVTAKMPVFLLAALVLMVAIIYWNKLRLDHKIYLFMIIGVSAALTLAWAYYAKDINTGAYWGRNVDTAEQLNYILSSPLLFVENLTYSVLNFNYINITYSTYANGPFYTAMPWVLSAMLVVALFLSPFVRSEKKKADSRQLALYWSQVALFVIVVLIIFTLLYLQFTPIGTPNRIDGIQARYFLPYLALLCMSPIALRLSRHVKYFVYSAPFVGALVYLAFIVRQIVQV